MGRTYDALKKAMAERAQQRGAPAGGPPADSPLRPPDGESRVPRIHFDLSPRVEEQYQRLRQNLFTGPRKGEVRALLIVASTHGEGATTTATQLALVMAKTNLFQVLLVEANLRTPALAEVFQLLDDPRGLSDLLVESTSLEEVIRPTPFSNLSVITSGRPHPSPANLFDGTAIDGVLQALRERYGLIILDGAPVKDYADSCFVGSKVDGIILVIEAEKTRLDSAQDTKRELERSGGRVLGAVLNKKVNYLPAFLERLL